MFPWVSLLLKFLRAQYGHREVVGTPYYPSCTYTMHLHVRDHNANDAVAREFCGYKASAVGVTAASAPDTTDGIVI